jgi:hypothetical protein
MIISQVLGVGQGSSFRFRELRSVYAHVSRPALQSERFRCGSATFTSRASDAVSLAWPQSFQPFRQFVTFRSCSANSACYLRWGGLRRVA